MPLLASRPRAALAVAVLAALLAAAVLWVSDHAARVALVEIAAAAVVVAGIYVITGSPPRRSRPV